MTRAQGEAYVEQLEDELEKAKVKIAELEAASTDKALIDWLEQQFTGTFRASIFIAHEIGDGESIVLDQKLKEIVRGKSVREVLTKAMKEAR